MKKNIHYQIINLNSNNLKWIFDGKTVISKIKNFSRMKLNFSNTGYKIVFSLFLFSGACSSVNAQNVGINATGATPNASAILDISSTNKGLLIPNVALIQTTLSNPVSSPATSLLIYNSATANDVTPGYYFWTGTVWSPLGAQGSIGLTGPAGPAGPAPSGTGIVNVNGGVLGTPGQLTGDVTTSGAGLVTTIADNSVDGSDIDLGSSADGGIMYFNGTDWVNLAAGTAGQVLQTNGAAAPSWVTKKDKFSIPFSNAVTVQNPAANLFWFFIGSGNSGIASTGQAATPDRTGSATPNNAFVFYTASSACKLEKLSLTLNPSVASRTFSVVVYKYSNIANSAVFTTGVALTSVQNITTSATAFGNSTITLLGNGTQINEGDFIVIMLKNSNASLNLYYSGSMELSY